ncbi:MAG: CPBP family intramembrane metalloprotease [Actinobacteria bacterium]|nr:CPBP family intramembrane metalloprotease [Actinomycetota bacterium]MBV8597698.1 CPBP family intramembrane metalloprotease [Actinomycetota bacterium]
MNVLSGNRVDLRRLVWWSLLVGLLMAVNYYGRATQGKPAPNTLYQYGTFASGLVQYALILGALYAISRGDRQLLALRRPRSWRRALLLAFGALVAIAIVTQVLDPLLHGAREQGLTPKGWEPSHAGAYVANAVLIAGVAPFVEELLFRGLGFSLLRGFGVWKAILAIGIVFAAAHGLVEAFPELAFFGAALAWLRSRTESVYPGMLVHATFNAVALVAAVVK